MRTRDDNSVPILKVSDFTKYFGSTRALNGLSFELQEPEIVGLIGANGSGKTTFFRCLIGVEAADKGSVQVYGEDPFRDMEVNQEILLSSVETDLQYMKIKKAINCYEIMYDNFDREFAEKAFDLFQVDRSKRYRSFSTGMKSVIKFVLAVSSRVSLTLLDEPFTGVDIEKRKFMYDILLGDYLEHPRTFLISSHNLLEIEKLLSRMVMIDEGKLIFNKPMDQVQSMLLDVSGGREAVEKFELELAGSGLVQRLSLETGLHLIVNAELAPEAGERAGEMGLEVRSVDPESVFTYMKSGMSNKSLEGLWDHRIEEG